MKIEYLDRHITIALSLLPEKMDTPAARAMMIAIAIQESDLEHRSQRVRRNGDWAKGPARGYYQFEPIGVRGVLEHPQTRDHIKSALRRLDYDETLLTSYAAIEFDTVIASVYARLNLWWLPDSLPDRSESGKGWDQYLKSWRPGKPKPEKWATCFKRAWDHVAQS